MVCGRQGGGGLNTSEMQVEAPITENPHKPGWSDFLSQLDQLANAPACGPPVMCIFQIRSLVWRCCPI